MPVYLWTVPMFTAIDGNLRGPWQLKVVQIFATAKETFDSIAAHHVSHMLGAPTVLNMIVNSLENERIRDKVTVMTGGAPSPPHVLFKMEELGFKIRHSYGLTETYGPATICVWKPEWDSVTPTRAKIKSRQGMQHLGMEEFDVKNPDAMMSVPLDGKTMGEVMFRGNTVMNGYLKDEKTAHEAFKGGWFRSGDLGVKHPDVYIELKDRSKDIIISGGENIRMIEVESVIFSHPSVIEPAVAGRPDDHWGETPCAFAKLKVGCEATAGDIIKFCRDRLPHYRTPRQ